MLGSSYKAERCHSITQCYPQYVKQEEMKVTENGREARATRLITERASGRIGRMAFELANARPRKARINLIFLLPLTN